MEGMRVFPQQVTYSQSFCHIENEDIEAASSHTLRPSLTIRNLGYESDQNESKTDGTLSVHNL